MCSPLFLPLLVLPDLREDLFVDLNPLALLGGARGLVLGAYRRTASLGRSREHLGGGLKVGAVETRLESALGDELQRTFSRRRGLHDWSSLRRRLLLLFRVWFFPPVGLTSEFFPFGISSSENAFNSSLFRSGSFPL